MDTARSCANVTPTGFPLWKVCVKACHAPQTHVRQAALFDVLVVVVIAFHSFAQLRVTEVMAHHRVLYPLDRDGGVAPGFDDLLLDR
jgi:hypothetical protein